MKYDFAAIESKWQKKWEEEKPYAAITGDPRPKFYGLIEFPYPSAAGLHVPSPGAHRSWGGGGRRALRAGFYFRSSSSPISCMMSMPPMSRSLSASWVPMVSASLTCPLTWSR